MPNPVSSRAGSLVSAAYRSGDGYRLAAGGLAAYRRDAGRAARPDPENLPASSECDPWEPILPHFLARSRVVRLVTGLVCDPPRPRVADSWARARDARLPQTLALCIAGAALGTLALYWGKSYAAKLDGEITRIVQATRNVHARTATLRVEWALLNNPDRLGPLADHHLSLHPVEPTQYAELANLAQRLPPVSSSPAEISDPPDPESVSQPETAPPPDALVVNLPPIDIPAPHIVLADAIPEPPPLNTNPAPEPDSSAETAMAAVTIDPPPETPLPLPSSPPVQATNNDPAIETPAVSRLAPQQPIVQHLATQRIPTQRIPDQRLPNQRLAIQRLAIPQSVTQRPFTETPAPQHQPSLHAANTPLTAHRVVWAPPVVLAHPGVLRVAVRAPLAPVLHAPPATHREIAVLATARLTLPGWLTQQHDTSAPRLRHLATRTMSAQPHFLDTPRTEPTPESATQSAHDQTPTAPPVRERPPEDANPAQSSPAETGTVETAAQPDDLQSTDSQPQEPALPPLRQTRRYAWGQPPPQYRPYYGPSPYDRPYYPPPPPNYWPYAYR